MHPHGSFALAITAALLLGCGGSTLVDSGDPAGVGGSTAGPFDLFTLVSFTDGGPLGECISCLSSQCATAINACANDQACRQGIACALTTCIPAGVVTGQSSVMTCVGTCFQGELSTLTGVAMGLACIGGTCRSSCSGVVEGGLATPQ